MRCEFKASPNCTNEAEVHLRADNDLSANVCVPCGWHYQTKFPHRVGALTITPLPEEGEA